MPSKKNGGKCKNKGYGEGESEDSRRVLQVSDIYFQLFIRYLHSKVCNTVQHGKSLDDDYSYPLYTQDVHIFIFT